MKINFSGRGSIYVNYWLPQNFRNFCLFMLVFHGSNALNYKEKLNEAWSNTFLVGKRRPCHVFNELCISFHNLRQIFHNNFISGTGLGLSKNKLINIDLWGSYWDGGCLPKEAIFLWRSSSDRDCSVFHYSEGGRPCHVILSRFWWCQVKNILRAV